VAGQPEEFKLTTDSKVHTNIKGLPPGNYFTEYGYSQSYPWVEVSRTLKTITLAKVQVKKDPDWKPHFIAGGFAGHCTNQSGQTWLFDKINPLQLTVIRTTKIGWSRGGVRFDEGRAIEFYDYNF
jgi:hypothetical protein